MATDYLALAQEAFDASTTFLDANYRVDLDYSLRAFRNEHAAGSKYLSEEYKARSRLFRPKTRSIIRKNEAAGMQAAFSNREMVQVTPGNPDDVMSVASAAALKEIMEYRLSRTIPTFEIYLGGLQDAQVQGAVCSYQYWEYEKRADGTKVKDKPCIELRPLENLRFDACASWLDPVGTSPYWCDIIPMYVCDVRAMMVNEDDKTGKPKWKKYDDAVIMQARPDVMDSTRKSRLGQKQDPQDEITGIKNFDIVWVMRWFMRDSQGADQTFYTLGTEELLTKAAPIEEVYFHGRRPYVMGFAILETHKVWKTSMPVLVRPLQQETNAVSNDRLDNVKFVLHKRWMVARGRQVDVQSLVRGVPGGVTLMTDPKNDVQESNWPDVTSSAYVEHDRLNAEFDDLAGNFSPSTKVANNAVNDTLGGSKMAAAGAGLMSEYLIRTVNETWWEKVLRQLALLEQYYETDETVLAVCANKARLFPRFGISRITDMMLMNEVNVTVDMAMGDPNQRMQKFIMATQSAIGLVNAAPPGFNVMEGIKEIYANAGYRDGARFFGGEQDPRLAKAMQMIKQMQGVIEGKQMELQAQGKLEQAKLQSNERVKEAELQVDKGRIAGDLQIRQAELLVEQQRIELEKLKLRFEIEGIAGDHDMKMQEMGAKMEEARIKLEIAQHNLAGQAVKIAAEIERAQLQLATVRQEHANESKIGEVADNVTSSMSGVAEQIAAIKAALSESESGMGTMKSDIAMLGHGMGAMLGVVSQPKRKPKGFALKKDGKKTNAVVVSYDDGSQEEMAVS